MNEKLKEKILEALSSVLPITAIVLLISIILVPIKVGTIMMFLVGAVLLIVGMGFFSLGADMAMMPMGEGLGVQLSKTRKLWIVAFLTLLMGTIITIAEPDLQVLADQVTSIPNSILIGAVAIGVGIFLVIAILRILLKISLSHILIFCYIIAFALSFFVPKEFLAVAFDSGGVTTGPITVPFIMALGLGISSIRGDKDAHNDSFGFVSLCSVGPILAVMVLGIVYNPSDAQYSQITIPSVETTRDVVAQFAHQFPDYSKEVLIALTPILCMFFALQMVTRRYRQNQILRMIVGYIYTFFGLILFLTGVNIGFLPVGHLIGYELADQAIKWLLIPIGMLIGYYIVAAEPAVHVLVKQVEDVTNGAITQRSMKLSLSIGVAISVGLAMVRILTGISIYWIIIPGYLLAITLTFFVPKIFVGIAFDSGGVASGPMTSTFLLPLAIGACVSVEGNVLTDAFGVVAMVAMIPLIAIQIMGLIYTYKLKQSEIPVTEPIFNTYDLDESEEIIDYEVDLDE